MIAETPLEAARRLRPLILEHRDATEADRRLAQPIVDALIESRLCRMALPVADGGLEAPPLDALEVFAELASAEASVAWIVWNSSLVCWFARFLDAPVRAEVFGEPTFLYANSTRPSGKAVAGGDAFSVTGRWSLVSGCLHANWIPVMCLVERDGQIEMAASGAPHLRMVWLPRERYEIVDTWHVGGLRGTGSHDVRLDSERVPASHSFGLGDPSRFDSRFGRVPISATMAAGCASICLGIARASAAALSELARTKVVVGEGPSMRERAAVQSVVAKCDATLGARWSYLRETYARLWERLDSAAASLDDLAAVWGAAVTAALDCRSALTEIYATAGTPALYTDSPIERAHRDVHAVLQHVVLQPSWLEQVGRVRLGLEPTHPIFTL